MIPLEFNTALLANSRSDRVYFPKQRPLYGVLTTRRSEMAGRPPALSLGWISKSNMFKTRPPLRVACWLQETFKLQRQSNHASAQFTFEVRSRRE
jgi:hypothetical protein